jgi:hypothetical protein
MLQLALKHINEISSTIKLYSFFLLVSIERKNCLSMARESGVSRHKIVKYLDDGNEKEAKKALIKTSQELSKKYKVSAIAIDDVILNKPYSERNEDVTYGYSGVSKRVEKGMVFVTSAWTNGKECIQFDAVSWKRKKDCNNDEYIKKTDILINIVENNKQHFNDNVFYTFDGAYSSHKIIKYFIKNILKFIARFPRNRVVEIDGKKDNIEKQPIFQFKKNQKYKKAHGFYKGQKVVFIAQKRKGRNGKYEIIFFITNFTGYTAKQITHLYKYRWPIEPSYRRAKQKLGATDCQSLFPQKQLKHLFAIFIADAIACIHSIYKQNKNPYEYINHLRRQKMHLPPSYNPLFLGTFMIN